MIDLSTGSAGAVWPLLGADAGQKFRLRQMLVFLQEFDFVEPDSRGLFVVTYSGCRSLAGSIASHSFARQESQAQ